MTPANRILRAASLAGLALLACATTALALQWDVTAGEFHTHLVSTDGGFDLHVHDKATHGVIDTRKGKVVATLLDGGKPQVVPLSFVQSGLLRGARPLAGDWTLLVRFEMPGKKPTQVRYSSKMKAGSQDVAAGGKPAAHDHGGHDHQHAPKK
jgi:hypothetical protein